MALEMTLENLLKFFVAYVSETVAAASTLSPQELEYREKTMERAKLILEIRNTQLTLLNSLASELLEELRECSDPADIVLFDIRMKKIEAQQKEITDNLVGEVTAILGVGNVQHLAS